ncbi:MAG: pyrroloquinoline-quinone synthase PqqC [Streptosporangiales bacterium]|nr:pyrroloquinoline-quinone synthase PqqC [Streptosporangiales bacterium]
MTVITATSQTSELIERLRAKGGGYHDRHPFHERMNVGLLTPAQLRGWAANRFYYQVNLPRKDASVLANCPVPQVRVRWAQRILDHDGRPGAPGGIEAWTRLGEAMGLTAEEIADTRHVVPGVRFAVDAYVNFCRNRPWTEAVASSLTELFAPDLMGKRLAAFERHYPWIEAAGLEYFRNRLTQAPRDSEHALEVVTEYCLSPEQQDAAVAALSFKCDVLWSMMDAIDHAYPDEPCLPK